MWEIEIPLDAAHRGSSNEEAIERCSTDCMQSCYQGPARPVQMQYSQLENPAGCSNEAAGNRENVWDEAVRAERRKLTKT